MPTDPLSSQIAERLSGSLDPAAFERCAVDLLRSVYPSLAPVSGGNDAGFDGSIAHPDGPYPLICTTAKDVARNVERSCRERLARTAGPARAVVATSQALTPARRRAVIERAEALGVTIVNIHDRDDLAERLRRDPRWLRELLGLSGDPPALSAVPPNGRAAAGPAGLVGRDAELGLLRSLTGTDALVVGQPGSGKTNLHAALAAEGACLFAAGRDPAALAGAIRETGCRCVVVDDAHTRMDLVESLLAIRATTGAHFAVHANCWPHAERRCRTALRVPERAVVRVGPLDRDAILGVARSCGLGGPDALLALVVDQARGRPGLAVMLTRALLDGQAERVFTGEALADELLGRGELAAPRHAAALGVLAAGGDAGMPVAAAAGFLGVAVPELADLLAGLEAGGVVDDVGGTRLAVVPEALRGGLIARALAALRGVVTARQLFDAAHSKHDAACALLRARALGARFELSMLDAAISASADAGLWELVAASGPEGLAHVLERRPDRVGHAARALLAYDPARAVPALLDAAARGGIPEGAAEHPMGRLDEWVDGLQLARPGHLERRSLLVDSAIEWAERDPASRAVLLGRALARAMTPNFAGLWLAPGSDRVPVCVRGLHPPEDLRRIGALWDRVDERLAGWPRTVWPELARAAASWCCPQRFHSQFRGDPGPTDAEMRQVGRRMAESLLRVAGGHRGVRQWAAGIERVSRLVLQVETDPDFGAMFDASARTAADDDSRILRLESFGRRLAGMPAEDALALLGEFEAEAAEAGLGTPDRRWVAYHALAEATDRPRWWAGELARLQAPETHLQPFLAAELRADRAGAVRRLEELVCGGRYRAAATSLALGLDPPDSGVLGPCLESVRRGALGVYELAGLPMPMDTRLELLEALDGPPLAVAALAEWVRCRGAGVPERLLPRWREGVLAATDQDVFNLEAVLDSDGDLAADWVEARIRDRRNAWHGGVDGLFASAAARLSPSRRRSAVEAMAASPGFLQDEGFDAVVGDDAALFRHWLSVAAPARRLWPLAGPPSARWAARAFAALDAGEPEAEVVHAAAPRSVGGMGPMSFHYRQLVEAYEGLSEGADRRLARIVGPLLADARGSLAAEEARDRDEAVLGFREAHRRRYPR